jgi:hypothetical protein
MYSRELSLTYAATELAILAVVAAAGWHALVSLNSPGSADFAASNLVDSSEHAVSAVEYQGGAADLGATAASFVGH